ncbi:MAG: exo-alpha-sialidase [Planctomycetes bacterium]|nr:exo-alpha-sialidase [Planctomycetota bacterium]
MSRSALTLCACVVLLRPAGVAAQARGPGPWDNDLVLLESEDGVRFRHRGAFVERGGVATLIAGRDGRLVAAFQWFPEEPPEAFDRVAVSISEDDGGTWTPPRPIAVDGYPEDLVRPFDPTLVQLPDGRCRLYFTSRRGSPAAGPDFAPGELPAIHSAVSRDALRYQFEPGVRFGVEGEVVIDCAVARLGEEWHIFSPVQRKEGMAYHAVSGDGLSFRRLDDLRLEVRGDWLGCAVTIEGVLRFYGSGPDGWSATSADGLGWKLDPECRRPLGADPGVALTRSGKHLMVATGPSRRRRGGVEAGGAGERGPLPPELPGGRPFPEGQVAANDRFVYVLRGGVLYQFDATSLKLLKQARLPDERPRQREGGPKDERGQLPPRQRE